MFLKLGLALIAFIALIAQPISAGNIVSEEFVGGFETGVVLF